MIKTTILATAVIGGAVLAVSGPASADEHDRVGSLCAAPWQWNGPLSLLHEGHAPGYVACRGSHVGGRADISVLDDSCFAPWRWNGPLEILTVDRSPSRTACDGNPAG
ncbi:hypothetical protein [Lentzea sp.]|uniref:hypothetical protein n=1 Tax=Lentzea sp. TaxID=56099 RepID=UPI002CD01EDE|nr:hypothetical protein [Lentzea sp.]HUQ57860.1 hypothetical protein [Lentzea sp.]